MYVEAPNFEEELQRMLIIMAAKSVGIGACLATAMWICHSGLIVVEASKPLGTS